jgi:hypothetical protein
MVFLVVVVFLVVCVCVCVCVCDVRVATRISFLQKRLVFVVFIPLFCLLFFIFALI